MKGLAGLISREVGRPDYEAVFTGTAMLIEMIYI